MYFYFNYSKFPPLSKGGYFVLPLYLYHMKYLITESQIDNLASMYLDSLNLIRVNKDNKIYFKKSEEDSTSVIVYNKESGVCMVSYRVINEISDFFSMDKSDSKELIGKWVEKTLEMEVSHVKPLVAAQKRGGIYH